LGVIAGEVILVDSCAVIFICYDCYLFCWKKKDIFFACGNTVQYGTITIQNQFFGGIRSRPLVS
jgi:hypothetical protein